MEFFFAQVEYSLLFRYTLGKAVDMSVDHKPTDSAELNRIMNAGGHVGADERINGGLNLSRAIGKYI